MKSIEYYWKKAGFSPNKSQKEAIEHIEGPLFLTAGPGSGKTRVLLWRALNLIVYHEVDPAEIFLSTFTEKAAKQLKDGLRGLLGLVTNETGKPYDIARMSIGTVHSLCQKLLVDRRFNPGHTRRRAPVLIDELGQYFRLYKRSYWKEILAAGGFAEEETGQRAINDYLIGNDLYSRHVAVQQCMAFFNRLSEENFEPEGVTTDDAMLNSLLRMYEKYVHDLKESETIEFVDFSNLQKSAFAYFEAFEDAGGVFKHVIIDEYQDTNAIQELIYFRLAANNKNLCVVGDDDQSLYRFRGATVENLVDFESRCQTYLSVKPKRIDLSINYRSRKKIVDFYTNFITRTDWVDASQKGRYFRIHDKNIEAHSADVRSSVVVSSHDKAGNVYREIAQWVKTLKDQKIVNDYNEVAFLFPAMKGWGGMNTRVKGFIDALDEEGIPYYAPRAGRFLEVEEAKIIFGLFQIVFGSPKHRDREDASQGYRQFQDWLAASLARAREACAADSKLDAYLNDRKAELELMQVDFEKLLAHAAELNIDLASPANPHLPQQLAKAPGLSLKTQKALQSHAINQSVKQRFDDKKPFNVRYLINRLTALDWTILDLFYQINGFDFFRHAYSLAESGEDEGPICNLGLVTQYLSRFMEEYSQILTGQSLIENRFVNNFFGSFLYALFRLAESEYENADDPFPKGRVPFLTIHQSKGLEFPVVVMGGVFREEKEASAIEVAIRKLTGKDGEPLDRISKFDSMRVFYVGLSRAEKLLVLPRYTHAKAASDEFKEIFDERALPELSNLDLTTVPKEKATETELGKSYSYTGDYLLYRKCPRNYMIFRKYGFVPSRGQTMFFGRLIHETIEDVHHLVMAERTS